MHWYLVHTKPRQEQCALENLERQGYTCYLPMLNAEKIRRGHLVIACEPLFSRYLFVRLGQDRSSQSWTPIRSTKGVCNLVRFGAEPAKVADDLIAFLQEQETLIQGMPQRLFEAGDKVQLQQQPFTGIEGIYQMAAGEQRAMVLIELMQRSVSVSVSLASLRKAV